MPGLSKKVQKFEGWHYDAFAGVVQRRKVQGRDLTKTSSTPFLTLDSIPSAHVGDAHLASLTLPTTPISAAAEEFSQHFSSYDLSFTSTDSSIDDSIDLSSSTASSSPMVLTGVGLGIQGLTRKDGGDPFDGLGLVHISRPRGDSTSSSSDGGVSSTILHEAAITFLQPCIPTGCFEIPDRVVLALQESMKTNPVDIPLPRNRPPRS
ncbi:uncharacterized protein BT62DRAFT_693346 [Guyanagaster necrorhizus]|uniref:Uncharacterized protein n=1 Tax=Guyanagaster necrorhizus TaxID=856835 RepID=A0A9P8ALJ6_9AGAR|nr:uncharacterized protein BT62DRAFT_693346 [Guyanagaster necrorhizus MCA 3950]KAG7439716.1 hypothetical protein BT62DRAFT_693346 [Guyanagaster necrorhizus MCA 3950]